MASSFLASMEVTLPITAPDDTEVVRFKGIQVGTQRREVFKSVNDAQLLVSVTNHGPAAVVFTVTASGSNPDPTTIEPSSSLGFLTSGVTHNLSLDTAIRDDNGNVDPDAKAKVDVQVAVLKTT